MEPWVWAVAAAIGLGYGLHLIYWHRRLAIAVTYESEEELPTPDGLVVQLRRVPGSRVSPLPPVVMVHGLSANHRNHDLRPDLSLARELAAAGRDVWLITTRSGQTELRLRRRSRLRFAPMARYDVPIAIGAVLQRTGAEQVDYVGFSMGGILMYAVIGNRYVDPACIRRAVAIGSPGEVGSPVPHTAGLFPLVPRRLVPSFPVRLAVRSFAFLLEWFRTPVHQMIYNPANVAPGVARLAAANVLVDIPGSLNADFKEWVQQGGEITIDQRSILRGLPDIDIPVRFFAGTVDRLAPVSAVRRAYDAWGGSDKALTILDDYGHGDLAVGAHVTEDVHPAVLEFLMMTNA